MTINTIGTGSNTSILGAPFTATNSPAGMARFGGPSVSWFQNLDTAVSSIYAGIDSGSTTISFACVTAAAVTITNVPNLLKNGTRVAGTITYTT
jgi:hypothetical protein